MEHPPLSKLRWLRAWRIIPTLYPEEPVYAPIAAAGDWEAITSLERQTNSGVHQEQGDCKFLRAGDVLPKGKSAYYIGRPFAFPGSSRFSDGRFGIYYAAKELETAVYERRYHAARFMARTSEPAGTLKQRVLAADIHAPLHDIRQWTKKRPGLYRSDNYTESQKFGVSLWKDDSNGIVYQSVRRPPKECIAVFRPQIIRHCRQERCLQFNWDGKAISHIYEIHEFLQ